MSESALNDAMGAILTFTVVGFVVGGSEALQPLHIIKELFWEAGGGILIGASLGYVTAILMAHAALGIFRSHLPFLIVLAVIITF